MTAVEEPDEISALVDWQLSKRSVIDNSMWTCHKCRCRWQSGPMTCPECGERRKP